MTRLGKHKKLKFNADARNRRWRQSYSLRWLWHVLTRWCSKYTGSCASVYDTWKL